MTETKKLTYNGMNVVMPSDELNDSYTRIKDYETLEQYSEIIVIGKILSDGSQENLSFYDYDLQKDIVYGYISYNQIEVLKVFKGDVAVGDKLNICQDYGVTANDELYSQSKLTPMEKDDEWLFFLELDLRHEDYTCSANDFGFGRYPIPTAEIEETVDKLEELSTKKPKNWQKEYKKEQKNLKTEDFGVFSEENIKIDIYSKILDNYDFS
ncbi:hypothetical protein FACS1894132_14090 [Clostridia bacterium]|nr:hypothetical protein FACS1894132_14090 [Clostridia bacterium]